MKLSASNIAWTKEQDEVVYQRLQSMGFSGLEIAPTRWFAEKPYKKLKEACQCAKSIKSQYGFSISSMQSIWYGRSERIVESKESRKALLEYTEQALCFADAIECPNLVFGCPKNRAVDSPEQKEIVVDFLADVAHMAEKYSTVIALEPNPTIYNTNFANTTLEAIQIIRQINSPALRLNLDFGTVIANSENLDFISDSAPLIHHVHISEPMLKPIEHRAEHHTLRKLLEEKEYDGYVSLEMGNCHDGDLLPCIEYLLKAFASGREDI